MVYYIIQNKIDHEAFWSNDLGWVDRKNSTMFDSKEMKEYLLPIDGWWVEL